MRVLPASELHESPPAELHHAYPRARNEYKAALAELASSSARPVMLVPTFWMNESPDTSGSLHR